MKILLVNCSPVKDGATAEIVKTAASFLERGNEVRSVCIDDYDIHFCKGCRRCHTTAECVQKDDVPALLGEFDRADTIICVSPSYWADIPGQFKAFIDRCTPWCNTHEPHAKLKSGKRGYVIALRTGQSMRLVGYRFIQRYGKISSYVQTKYDLFHPTLATSHLSAPKDARRFIRKFICEKTADSGRNPAGSCII